MFGWFKRKPSPYAVAIRDSLINEPDEWCRGCHRLDRSGRHYVLRSGDIEIDTRRARLSWPEGMNESRADRRVIREGIEAWIAWSLTRKETT